MRFEGNVIVSESTEDEVLLEEGRKNKKRMLYGIYILSILVEESSCENPLKVKDICKRVLERYKVLIDISTIQEYMKVFENIHGYQIRKNKDFSYYATKESGIYISEDERLTDYEINYLAGLVTSSRKLYKCQKYQILEKLSMLCFDETNSDYVSEIIHTNKAKDKLRGDVYHRLLNDVPRIMKSNLVMKIKLKRRGFDSLYNKFKLYAVIPRGESLLLIGSFSESGIARVVIDTMIENYNILEAECFERKKLVIKQSVFISEDDINYLKSEYYDDFIFQTKDELDELKRKLKKQETKGA